MKNGVHLLPAFDSDSQNNLILQKMHTMNFISNIKPVDQQEINKRLESIFEPDNSPKNKLSILREIVSFIDLTTLNGDDTQEKVKALCSKGKNTENREQGVPAVAAICVYPNFARQVSESLIGTGIKTAVVATGFPSGQTFREVKLLEVKKAVEEGAEEIDMVISRGVFLEKNYDEVYSEIKAVKEACGQAHLKVILETGELENLTQVKIASHIAMEAGADFIKTSTGKIKPAATTDAFLVMTDAIKEFYERTGKKIGIKPAGGISDAETALQYYSIVKENLGEGWLNNELFRIGASSLLDKLLQSISK
jgi:deoxyribose-phosphate aldolase